MHAALALLASETTRQRWVGWKLALQNIYKEGMQDMAEPVTIRPATINDAEALARLHVRSWQWAYRGQLPDEYLDRMPETMDRRIEARRAQLTDLPPDHRWWIAEQAGQMVGFAVTEPSRDADALPSTGELSLIYLEQDAAGKGIGRALFAHAVEDLRQRGYAQAILWVLETNARARRFYEAAGWQADGASKTEEWPGVLLREVRYRITL
jgi:ribosomal protein S18 acetylase RimI-like enzyme